MICFGYWRSKRHREIDEKINIKQGSFIIYFITL